MGELFAHFEKKLKHFGKGAGFSRNFLAIFTSVELSTPHIFHYILEIIVLYDHIKSPNES